MSKKSEDYYSMVEQIIDDPESYDHWAASSSDRDRNEIKEIIKNTFDFGEDLDYR